MKSKKSSGIRWMSAKAISMISETKKPRIINSARKAMAFSKLKINKSKLKSKTSKPLHQASKKQWVRSSHKSWKNFLWEMKETSENYFKFSTLSSTGKKSNNSIGRFSGKKPSNMKKAKISSGEWLTSISRISLLRIMKNCWL